MDNRPAILARWFDGQRAAGQTVEVTLQGDALHFGDRAVPLSGVSWPERLRHGQRQMLLRGGGVMVFDDAASFDAWADATGHRPGWVERAQLSWRLALMSLALLLTLLSAGWRWGLPWAADRLVAQIPLSAEEPIGAQVMELLDRQLLRPSRLSEGEQQRWRVRFAQMMEKARASGMQGVPASWQLHFRRTSDALGPNAFALPGGQMCITDELIDLVKDEPDAVMTVLAHELGHVSRRHGLRLGLRAGVAAAVSALWLGDYSSLLNGLPTVVVTASYSRDHEREADAFGRELAWHGGVDPARIAVFFERVRKRHGEQGDSPLAIAFSTHPADAERIAFFRADRPARDEN